MIPQCQGEGNWVVCHVAPGRDKNLYLIRFRDPLKAKAECDKLNRDLAVNHPSRTMPTDFYFVHSINGASVPWLASVDRDELPPNMGLKPICLECGSDKVNRRNLCRTCYLDRGIRLRYPITINKGQRCKGERNLR